jgi:DNA-binding GntR family transcriptional regulator
MDIRDALDPLLLTDALLHRSPHHLQRMREQLDRMGESVAQEDGIEFVHSNWQLHAAIANTSPRPVLKAFYLTLLNLIEEHTISVASDAKDRPLAGFHRDRFDIHVRLVDAIEQRDAESATEALRLHNAGIARPGN